MSTVKATYFQHGSASTPNLTLASDGSVSGGLPSPNRNLLYNGAMQVAQRGTSTTGITTQNYYTADRWGIIGSTFGTWTQDIQTDAPSGSGLRNSLRMLCTTANASLSAGSLLWLEQKLEGQDVQRIAKGTSSAQQLTLSFWVKSNVTGTYIAMLFDDTNTRQVSASYTVSASATWEKKSITFPADTSGVLANSNASALRAIFFLVAGSDNSSGTLQTTWGSSVAANRAVGQVNVAASTNNYWQVTGVQLEVGPVPTAFEFKSYGQELRECQRYYLRINSSGNAYTVMVPSAAVTNSTRVDAQIAFPVTMRANPSGVEAANLAFRNFSGSPTAWTSPALDTATTSPWGALIYGTVSGATAGQFGCILANNSTSAYLGITAEL